MRPRVLVFAAAEDVSEGKSRCLADCINNLRDFWHLQMLSYGCTRLEIGLQSIYEDVARDTNRGHTVAAVGDCFRLAKNAGFKACFGAVTLPTKF